MIPEHLNTQDFNAMSLDELNVLYYDWLDCELYTSDDLEWLRGYIKERENK